MVLVRPTERMSRLRSNSGGSDGGGRKHGSAWADPFKNPTAQDDSDLAAMRARAMEALGVTPPSRPGRLRRSGSFGSLKTGTKRKLEPLHWDGKRPTTTSASQSAKLRTREYAGLVNQASTCYLNSLLQVSRAVPRCWGHPTLTGVSCLGLACLVHVLQTLFMTPELRSVLYAWEVRCTMLVVSFISSHVLGVWVVTLSAFLLSPAISPLYFLC